MLVLDFFDLLFDLLLLLLLLLKSLVVCGEFIDDRACGGEKLYAATTFSKFNLGLNMRARKVAKL